MLVLAHMQVTSELPTASDDEFSMGDGALPVMVMMAPAGHRVQST
jgi:hypothetical protein